MNVVFGLAVDLRQCDDVFDVSCRGELRAVAETETPLIVFVGPPVLPAGTNTPSQIAQEASRWLDFCADTYKGAA